MKAVVQRVRGQTSIEVGDRTESFHGPGLVILLGWDQSDADDLKQLAIREEWILSRVLGLRVFPDVDGRMNKNLEDYLKQESSTGGFLWVSQFTLSAQLESGFRPSFTNALQADLAQTRYTALVEKIRSQFVASAPVKHLFGTFGGDMSLTFTNWGPVTICL
jgi:D-aminoacyl-tRNA deacylase